MRRGLLLLSDTHCNEAVIDVNKTDTFCITFGKFKIYNKKVKFTGKYTLSDLVFC